MEKLEYSLNIHVYYAMVFLTMAYFCLFSGLVYEQIRFITYNISVGNGGFMKLSHYLKKYWYAYFFAILCTVAAVSLDMITPLVTKSIIDDVLMKREIGLLPKLLIIILLIGLGRSIFQYVRELIYDIVSSTIATEIRKKLFVHIQGLSLNFFDNNNTGELMSRVKDDVDRLWFAFGYVTMLIIQVIIHTAIALYCMFRIDPILAIIPTLVLPIVGLLALLMEKKLGSIYEAISEENANLNTVAQENLAGVRTVKSFAREKFEISKFLSHNKKYHDLNMKQSKVFIKLYPYFQLISKLLPLSIIVLGGYKVINSTMTLGSLGAFVEYSMNIVWPMEMIGWLTNDFASAIASNKRIQKIFDEKPQIIEPVQPILLDTVNGSIEFDQVSFSMGDKDILSNVSFQLASGKALGVMGATGSGKSSIINLLQRFYDVTEGSIKVDGVNVKDMSLKQLRKSLSLVMQDIFLFSDTIEENVKIGDKHTIGLPDIVNAAGYAQARDFIERMDSQYDTVIGERGVGLSGGQKQRISIARALAKKSPILILDDSTSALDMETEHEIQKALVDVEASKIIIAHRISAVRNADEIIILDNGKITERGTHDQLLKLKGYYYETYQAQYDEHLKNNITSPSSEEVATCQ